VGDICSGKTLLLTQLGLEEAEKGREIYANYDLTVYAKTTYPEIAKHWHVINNLPWFFRERMLQAGQKAFKPFQDLLLIDEAYAAGFEARASMSPFVTLMSRLIFLSRKLGFELVMAVQLASSLEKRARFLAEMWALATKEFLADGTPYFRYYRWQVHPVSTELVKLPTVRIDWDWAQNLFKCYESTRPTSSEYETTLAELDEMFMQTPAERVHAEHAQLDELLRLQIFQLFALNPLHQFTVEEVVKKLDLEMKVSEAAPYVRWLNDNKLLADAGMRRGRKTYQLWK
jgi:hypothetical protein